MDRRHHQIDALGQGEARTPRRAGQQDAVPGEDGLAAEGLVSADEERRPSPSARELGTGSALSLSLAPQILGHVLGHACEYGPPSPYRVPTSEGHRAPGLRGSDESTPVPDVALDG